jgi:glycosyltransferase involved in cell wall biosynthesis
VNLQHEYGIYDGGAEFVPDFLRMIRKPVVTTLHTLLEQPDADLRNLTQGIIQHSDLVVVMANFGVGILEREYGISIDKVRYIEHGCPNVPYVRTASVKRRLGLGNRLVMSTFGLLSRGKGIEYAIKALPQIEKECPGILYLIVGETHPEVRKREGETYRQSLLDLVASLGVQDNAKFVNRFLSEDELINYLEATDVYILPYPNQQQISSGTLTYAMGTGRAIVTTPFLQAEEAISSGAAIQCEFGSPDSIAQRVKTLLKDRQMRLRFRKTAYDYSRPMIWPNVAMKYVNACYYTLGL